MHPAAEGRELSPPFQVWPAGASVTVGTVRRAVRDAARGARTASWGFVPLASPLGTV